MTKKILTLVSVIALASLFSGCGSSGCSGEGCDTETSASSSPAPVPSTSTPVPSTSTPVVTTPSSDENISTDNGTHVPANEILPF